jgi:hypothetical protein
MVSLLPQVCCGGEQIVATTAVYERQAGVVHFARKDKTVSLDPNILNVLIEDKCNTAPLYGSLDTSVPLLVR